MKVIAVDNQNRDYHPDRLITVSISKDKAQYIANQLNNLGDGSFYDVVPDEYSLNLESSNGERPDKFIKERLGLSAFEDDNNFLEISLHGDILIKFLNAIRKSGIKLHITVDKNGISIKLDSDRDMNYKLAWTHTLEGMKKEGIFSDKEIFFCEDMMQNIIKRID